MKSVSANLTTFAAMLVAGCGAASAATTLTYPVSASPTSGPVLIQPGPWVGTQGTYQAFTDLANIALGKPVTVSGTIPGHSPIHLPENLTDGFYGNGSSWIQNGVNPSPGPVWFTVDLGSAQLVTSVMFGRDRLGFQDDRHPGVFTVSYSTDNSTFTPLYTHPNSLNFAAGESAKLSFDPVSARYVQVSFSNAGAAIDEVQITAVPEPEAYMLAGVGLGVLAIWTRRRRAAH